MLSGVGTQIQIMSSSEIAVASVVAVRCLLTANWASWGEGKSEI